MTAVIFNDVSDADDEKNHEKGVYKIIKQNIRSIIKNFDGFLTNIYVISAKDYSGTTSRL